MCLCLTHLRQDVGELLTLPLGTDVRAQPPLQELESTLVLRHLQQFHRPFLVGGMAGHFADQVPHEFSVFRLYPLQPGRSDLGDFGFARLDFGGSVALLQTDRDLVPYCHPTIN